MSNVEIAESVRVRARWTMILLGLGGVLLVVAGVSMRLLAQPSGGWFAYMPDDSSVISESVDSIGYTVDTSTGGGMLSGVLVLVGLALLLVGLIAWGVRLGREASRV